MSGITRHGLIVFHCVKCGANNSGSGFDIRSLLLWTNQYGHAYRLFCNKCDSAYDHAEISGKLTITRVHMGRAKWQEQGGAV